MLAVFEKLQVSAMFKNSITAALQTGRLSHALILEEGDAATRLQAAKEIACAVLCDGESKPCGVCSKCRKVLNGIHPDLHILSKDEKSSMIKVDSVRELKKKALIYPNDGNKSVFIIYGAEYMNPQAQNALLKIFEEPARHLLFILCCKSKSSLLDTVISRATLYSLGQKSSKECDSEKEEKAVNLADGLLSCLAEENEIAFLRKISVMQKDKELFRLTLNNLILILRDAIVLKSSGNDMLTDCFDTAKKLSTRLTASKILRLINAVEELEENSKLNANHNLTLTRLSALFYSIKST